MDSEDRRAMTSFMCQWIQPNGTFCRYIGRHRVVDVQRQLRRKICGVHRRVALDLGWLEVQVPYWEK